MTHKEDRDDRRETQRVMRTLEDGFKVMDGSPNSFLDPPILT